MAENKLVMILVAVVILGAAVFMLGGSDDATTTPVVTTPTTSDSSSSSVAVDVVDDVTLTIKDRDGALADTDGIAVYVTTANTYDDVNDALADSIDDAIPSPFSEGETVSAYSLDENGQVTLTLMSGTDAVTYYQLIIIDEDAGVADDYVNCIKTIGVIGENNDGVKTLEVVTDSVSDIDAFKQVKLVLRSDMTVINDETAVSSYTYITDVDSDIVDAEKSFDLGTLTDYSAANEISIYVEEVSDAVGTAALYINEVSVNGESYSPIEVTTANFDSRSAIFKNAPTATGTLYVLDGSFSIALAGDDSEELAITVNYDCDLSAATTTDEANILIHFVSFNSNEDSEQETETFTFAITEDATATAGFA